MRALVLLLGCLSAAGLCVAQTAPVTTIGFDRDFNGMTTAGPLVGTPELTPGKVGQALKSGSLTGYVGYTAPLLKRETETVERRVQACCPGGREATRGEVAARSRGELRW